MKKIVLSMAVLALIAACGGSGSSGPTPTPTSDQTKAATQAAGDEATGAAGAGIQYALANMTPTAMIVKEASQNYSATINTTNNCGASGSVGVTGTATATCTGTPEAEWSCSSIMGSMVLAFTDCAKNVTVGGTTYSVILNGTADSTLTGSVSGVGQSFTSVSYEMLFTGSPVLNATGDIAGTVDISALVVTGSATGEVEPTNVCSGTTTVVINSTSQVCGVSSDCTSCTE